MNKILAALVATLFAAGVYATDAAKPAAAPASAAKSDRRKKRKEGLKPRRTTPNPQPLGFGCRQEVIRHVPAIARWSPRRPSIDRRPASVGRFRFSAPSGVRRHAAGCRHQAPEAPSIPCQSAQGCRQRASPRQAQRRRPEARGRAVPRGTAARQPGAEPMLKAAMTAAPSRGPAASAATAAPVQHCAASRTSQADQRRAPRPGSALRGMRTEHRRRARGPCAAPSTQRGMRPLHSSATPSTNTAA